MRFQFICLMASVVALSQGCAGQRESYKKLMDQDLRVIRLTLDSREEVLAIGNGFPGWWGYYPEVVSGDSRIASIDCVASRSAIPFRKPGMVFGGERCFLTANAPGETWIIQTNKFANFGQQTDQLATNKNRIRVVVSQ